MNKKSDIIIYLLGIIFGIGAGIADVRNGDLLVTAILVMLSTLILGVLRPERAWRWMIVVAACVPTVQLLAHVFLTEQINPSHMYLACSGFLTGTVGTYAGAFARMGINLLVLPEKKP